MLPCSVAFGLPGEVADGNRITGLVWRGQQAERGWQQSAPSWARFRCQDANKFSRVVRGT